MDAITQEDLMIIKNAILNILEGVEAIYLFGSVARGTHNAGSDYDIVAFVKKAPKNKVKIVINIKHDVSDRIKRPIDLFILGLDDLQFASHSYTKYSTIIICYMATMSLAVAKIL